MKNFNEMGKVELRASCKEAGIKNYGKMNNDGMRAALVAHYAPQEEVRAEAEQQVEQVAPAIVGRNNGNVDPRHLDKCPECGSEELYAGIKIEKDREERNGVKRPSIGGACRMVWDYLDSVVAAGDTPTIKQVKATAEEYCWNVNNSSIEFYQWRKFNGIRGRQPKA